jgi:hypothetical protein
VQDERFVKFLLSVISAKAGIQGWGKGSLDSRLRGNNVVILKTSEYLVLYPDCLLRAKLFAYRTYITGAKRRLDEYLPVLALDSGAAQAQTVTAL